PRRPIVHRVTCSKAVIAPRPATITSRGFPTDLVLSEQGIDRDRSRLCSGAARGRGMKRSAIETVMGAVVLLVAATFLAFAYSSSNVSRVEGYEVLARFNRVDGVASGTEVRMSGIKIG